MITSQTFYEFLHLFSYLWNIASSLRLIFSSPILWCLKLLIALTLDTLFSLTFPIFDLDPKLAYLCSDITIPPIQVLHGYCHSRCLQLNVSVSNTHLVGRLHSVYSKKGLSLYSFKLSSYSFDFLSLKIFVTKQKDSQAHYQLNLLQLPVRIQQRTTNWRSFYCPKLAISCLKRFVEIFIDNLNIS